MLTSLLVDVTSHVIVYISVLRWCKLLLFAAAAAFVVILIINNQLISNGIAHEWFEKSKLVKRTDHQEDRS